MNLPNWYCDWRELLIMIGWVILITLAIIGILALCVWLIPDLEAGEIVDLSIISQIESDNDTLAFNPKTRARGAFQVTPICLQDFNNWNKEEIWYTTKDMFYIERCEKVADWYLNIRIPQLLKHYKLEDCIDNRLIAYHDGISNLIKYKQGKRKLGAEMKAYLKKYQKLAEGK